MSIELTKTEIDEISSIQQWMNSSRFSRYNRDYKAIDVWKLRSTYQHNM